MNVIMISPGYPAEMALFARGLAATGASVIGVGDQPQSSVPQAAREALAHYEHVGSLAAGDAVAAVVHELARQVRIDRVECLWEPYMLLAARLREELGLPGLTMRQTMPFRDKELMKAVLDEAGLRTPGHHSTDTVAGVWAAAERLGYPLVVKPIAGAGSSDTYRADAPADLDAILPMVRHVPQVIVEEFIDGEEFTYDTICAGGEVLFENVCWYRPRPLLTKLHEWISPVIVSLRDLGAPDLQAARALGGRMVDAMNYATDADLFSGWAQAITLGRIAEPVRRRYNAGIVFKRAEGAGRITGYAGLDHLMAEFGEHVAAIDLLPVGTPRRDWRAVTISDGMVVVRHPELARTVEMTERFAAELHLYAG